MMLSLRNSLGSSRCKSSVVICTPSAPDFCTVPSALRSEYTSTTESFVPALNV